MCWAARTLVIVGVIGCAGAERAPARIAPIDDLPLPAGVDVAVRVDATALGADLGEGPTRQFLLDALSQGEPRETAQLLERSLALATVLWLGIEAGAPPATSMAGAGGAAAPAGAGRAVLVLRGRFASLADSEPGWASRGAGVQVLDLGGAPDGFARVYRLADDELMLWAPGAELAAVELAIRGESVGSALRPPERGAVSIAAEPQSLFDRYAARYPELAERFRGVRAISAFAEPTSGMWRADLTLDFTSAEQASVASMAVERLKQALSGRRCAIGTLARALVVSSFETNLRVQTVLLGAEVASLKACVLGNDCCV